MVEKPWDEMLKVLMPMLAIFPLAETRKIQQCMWEPFGVNQLGCVNWEYYSRHIRMHNVSEILAALEKLLQYQLDPTQQIVYVTVPDAFNYVIKTYLSLILENYYDIRWMGPMWIWSPVNGYIIEDFCFERITVGLVPKQPDPHPYFTIQKGAELSNFTRLTEFYHIFTDKSQTSILLDDKANKILSFYQTKFPFTKSGKIDWDRIEKKLAIGKDPAKIIPALEQLFDKPVSMTAYINWCDARFPLIKIDLHEAITRYNQIAAVTPETIIFNPTARYLIESDIFGNITVGTMQNYTNPFPNPTAEKDSSSCHFFTTNQFQSFISTFGITVIGDEQANQLLEKFRATIPFTLWGRVDWDKFDKKIVVGTDITGIIPALEKLTGSRIDPAEQVYLELIDPDIPLIKTGLKNAIESIPHTYNLAFELFIFNEKMAYVIEVDPLRTITVGVV